MKKPKFKVCQSKFHGVPTLVGHMKKPYLVNPISVQTQVADSASEASFQSSSSFELKEDASPPKRSFKVQDPELSSTLDRESQSETSKTKRAKKTTMIDMEQLSSVSITSPEEDLAICLMLLSRDASCGRPKKTENEPGKKKKKRKVVSKASRSGKFSCSKCMKRYRSSRALLSHKRICNLDAKLICSTGYANVEKIFECPYCFKLFGSGQALGGHKRSHLLNLNTSTTSRRTPSPPETDLRSKKHSFLDLNLPASPGEDDFSVVLEE